MTSYIKAICEVNDLPFKNFRAVSGGDINAAYAVDTAKGLYFIKLNSASKYPHMFQKEAEGLKALQNASLLRVPQVIATGEQDAHQYLLLEWLEKAPPSGDFWDRFAEGLAQLHRNSHSHFGWSSPNYIGSIVQQNEYTTSWSEFYITQRIMPLVKMLFNKASLSAEDVKAAEKLCGRFQSIFPAEPPSLLHGDLWGGNQMAVKTGNNKNSNSEIVPSVFDPAVYYGHREMDLGMSLLFGGFNLRFYEAYHSAFPLENNWRQRVSLTQLYPLLVHALLFGGGYISKCITVMQQWR